MRSVRLSGIRNYALRGVDAYFPGGLLSVIVGPNGAGKTTLLKVVAGLVRFEGKVYYDDIDVTGLPPYERKVSYVPQNNALFPNLTVYENIAFGLRARGVRDVDARVRETASMLGLSGLLSRYPAHLSGGEARKVALARALAVDPEILLLDEPFTNLDAVYQTVMEQEIMMTVKKLGKTVLMVTHSVERAVCNAGHLLVLMDGRVRYSGPVHRLFEAKLDNDTVSFLGNVVEADEIDCDGGVCRAIVGDIALPLANPRPDMIDGYRGVLIPSNSIRIARGASVKARVVDVEERKGYYLVWVDLQGRRLAVKAPFRPGRGETVGLRVSRAFLLSPPTPRAHVRN